MKANVISQNRNCFEVEITFNFLERIVGCKSGVYKYYETDRVYVVGGGKVYIDHNGYKLGNNSRIGNLLDRFQRLNKWA